MRISIHNSERETNSEENCEVMEENGDDKVRVIKCTRGDILGRNGETSDVMRTIRKRKARCLVDISYA